MLESFKTILESEGFSCDTVTTSLDALEKCRAHRYDLALRGIEGTVLLVEMHRRTPRMIKIILTSHASLEKAVESILHSTSNLAISHMKSYAQALIPDNE